MTHLYRRIFKSQLTGGVILRELLETMFASEMLAPGPVVYIFSPWISNIVLIDNRSGNYDSLNPEWGRREVRVTDVLVALMSRGTHVYVATRNDTKNIAFTNALSMATEQNGLEDLLSLYRRNTLHTKGIQLSSSSLMGSMNLTFYGLALNDEHVMFSIDPEDLTRTRLEFSQYVESM